MLSLLPPRCHISLHPLPCSKLWLLSCLLPTTQSPNSSNCQVYIIAESPSTLHLLPKQLQLLTMSSPLSVHLNLAQDPLPMPASLLLTSQPHLACFPYSQFLMHFPPQHLTGTGFCLKLSFLCTSLPLTPYHSPT